jgi:hypothetical protein
MLSRKQTAEQRNFTRQRVHRVGRHDRRFQIDAAIVNADPPRGGETERGGIGPSVV